jgi:hypothetical protein
MSTCRRSYTSLFADPLVAPPFNPFFNNIMHSNTHIYAPSSTLFTENSLPFPRFDGRCLPIRAGRKRLLLAHDGS